MYKSNQSGITSGFPDYGFPAYSCHSKHVFIRENSNSSQKQTRKVCKKRSSNRLQRDPNDIFALKDTEKTALKNGPAGFSIFTA